MKVDVYKQDGSKTNIKVELSDSIFGIEPNDHAIWLDIRLIQANKRQGTHQTKGRSFVSGGGRKPFRQKGTGRARQGTSRAPHHVGGGRVFGPEPRTYRMKVNKKVKQLARNSALTYKAKEDKIRIIENFDFDEPSTKKMLSILSSLDLADKKVLLCTDGTLRSVVKSAGNLYKVAVRDSVTISTYDVLKADTVLMQEGALKKVNEVFGR
ncbi:MAG: 50S ribosomal protein L4 [Calditrichaceae bacterium]|nr:50S ribosomal protein L4 [Calditrichaceae bacterium]HES58888.1 50S ribosomal protein L4 [Caldithrix sp.]